MTECSAGAGERMKCPKGAPKLAEYASYRYLVSISLGAVCPVKFDFTGLVSGPPAGERVWQNRAPKIPCAWHPDGEIAGPDLWGYPDPERRQMPVEVKFSPHSLAHGGFLVFPDVHEKLCNLLREFDGRLVLCMVSGEFPGRAVLSMIDFGLRRRTVLEDGSWDIPGMDSVPPRFAKTKFPSGDPIGWLGWKSYINWTDPTWSEAVLTARAMIEIQRPFDA